MDDRTTLTVPETTAQTPMGLAVPLERHSLVVEFWDDAGSHLGATIARLEPSR